MTIAVSLQRVESYDVDAVRAGLITVLDRLGGIGAFVPKSGRVLIKPNLLGAAAPAETHPVVCVELAKLIRDLGCTVAIGDSPAWSSMIPNARASGLAALADAARIPLIDLRRPTRIQPTRPDLCPWITVSRDVLDADAIVNLPKFKSHVQMGLSSSVKNLFGIVPGKRKAVWHFRLGKDVRAFTHMIIATYLTAKPTLTIVDGIDAMEGMGPIRGSHRPLNVLIASADAFAADIVTAEIIGMTRDQLPTWKFGHELGLAPATLADLTLLGDAIDTFRVTDFNHPRRIPLAFTLPRVIRSIILNLLRRWHDRKR